jgi:hypothetical protein
MAAELTDSLFPTTAVLAMNQQADVDHLQSHVTTGAGKQAELRDYGIWVFTPEELVMLCRAIYGWQ